MGRHRTIAKRPWTPGESAILARDYAITGGPAVARMLGRSLSSVYQHARAAGLVYQHRTIAGDAFRESVRSLHATGLSDPEIAGRLGCDRHTVATRRRAMGLPSNRTHPRQRSRVAEKTREQCKASGVGSLGEVRRVAFRAFALSSGWPGDITPREVHILDALSARGPMTRIEIAAAIGMPWIGSRRSLKGNRNVPGGSYLASLMQRGLVVDLGRIVRAGGRGNNSHLYSLALDAEREVADVGSR